LIVSIDLFIIFIFSTLNICVLNREEKFLYAYMAYGSNEKDVLVNLLNSTDDDEAGSEKLEKNLAPAVAKEPETNITTAIASTLRKFSQIADRAPIIETPAGQNDADEYSYEQTVVSFFTQHTKA
jgi:hypothetical protein